MQIITSFIIFSTICLILTYYFNLLLTQDVYTKQELTNIIPKLINMIKILYSKYYIFTLINVYIISGILAIIILSIFENVFFNSSIIPILVFIISPKLANFFKETKVTISENSIHVIELIFSKYFPYAIIGFNTGCITKLIDNWINHGFIDFLWMLIHVIIISVLNIYTLRKDIFL